MKAALPISAMQESGERLKKAREAAGYPSASAFANANGLTVSTYVSHENGTRGLTVSAAKRYAAILGIGWQHLIDAAPDVRAVTPNRGLTPENLVNESNVRFGNVLTRPDGRDLIPVLGATEGGDNGAFHYNGETVDRVARPPFLAGATHGYALYVVGESLAPRYHPGEIVYVHPGKPVTVGSYVVIQVKAPDGGETPLAFLKRLVRRTAKTVFLEQYNPKRTIEIPTADVVSIHRVVGAGES